MCFGPSTLGAGAKTRLESKMKKFTPHCICRPFKLPPLSAAFSESTTNAFQPQGLSQAGVASYHVQYVKAAHQVRLIKHIIAARKKQGGAEATDQVDPWQDLAMSAMNCTNVTLTTGDRLYTILKN